MQILMSLRNNEQFTESEEFDGDKLKNHLKSGKIGVIVARYGQTEDDQFWADIEEYNEEDGFPYALYIDKEQYLGKIHPSPVESFDKAIEIVEYYASMEARGVSAYG